MSIRFTTRQFGYAALKGIVVVIFVVLAGALSYTYITNYNAQVVHTPPASKSKLATTQPVTNEVPVLKSRADLENALQALDSFDVGNQLDDDLASLDVIAEQF